MDTFTFSIHTQIPIQSCVLGVNNLQPLDPGGHRSWANQECQCGQKGTMDSLDCSLQLARSLCVSVCVCDHVKSPSIGTTGTEWIDSNDWFYPFTTLLPPPPPPPLCVFLSASTAEVRVRFGLEDMVGECDLWCFECFWGDDVLQK